MSSKTSMAMIALCAAAAVLSASCARPQVSAAEVPSKRPSIILIVIDTLRADYLGAYGFDGPTSPNLDELAKESVVFERCSSQAPWTTPSMSSMFTSLYPEAHGVRLGPDDPRSLDGWRRRWSRAIPHSTTTLAECLRDRDRSRTSGGTSTAVSSRTALPPSSALIAARITCLPSRSGARSAVP